jgi:hypothetical protein
MRRFCFSLVSEVADTGYKQGESDVEEQCTSVGVVRLDDTLPSQVCGRDEFW